MKAAMILFSTAFLLLAGCKYDAPFVVEHRIAVDASVLGLWANADRPDEQMMVLKYSDTEYMVHYPVGEDGLYYRAWPVNLGGVSFVQIQVIGTGAGLPEPEDTELFYAVSYQVSGETLELKTLNTDLVPESLQTTDDLKNAFLQVKENGELFDNPLTFRRVEK
ncbi:hypothetical protein [Tichowtungia aerotolerans]|uniref:Lipocalin-like domain-containing protein n=1 Tax=Tichowtungia aerotolerans TaxID=2697043 RepID=A0A6P1MF11_9BACT|nr:hypothetical protein [Tichowtungia aerotolerans]QHI69665.1 hypothetical protein GT409_09430 [Tichowtungia aerotolerans]